MAVSHLLNGPGWAPHLSFGGLPGSCLGESWEDSRGDIIDWGLRPQYSSPQDSQEGLLEGLQKLKCGAHVPTPTNQTNEKLTYVIATISEARIVRPLFLQLLK